MHIHKYIQNGTLYAKRQIEKSLTHFHIDKKFPRRIILK